MTTLSWLSRRKGKTPEKKNKFIYRCRARSSSAQASSGLELYNARYNVTNRWRVQLLSPFEQYGLLFTSRGGRYSAFPNLYASCHIFGPSVNLAAMCPPFASMKPIVEWRFFTSLRQDCKKLDGGRTERRPTTILIKTKSPRSLSDAFQLLFILKILLLAPAAAAAVTVRDAPNEERANAEEEEELENEEPKRKE
ncbi:hypothetical protein GWI33_014792 [Rhynchophorus ferrugineus]|uniref:Uncharacterized protein n=1 Tax=Rhynchophorus ferrugineus TaxID=354439 RepID=A0A834I0V0_RHYFE|nr:hypothetical protein GWI33_014792 [Rhynchophorus ferrugineus]